MSSHRAELYVLGQLRRLDLRRNGLRRRSDRVEALILLVLLLIALLTIPAAAGLITVVRDNAESTAAQYRATVHPVQARTLQDSVAAVPVGIAWSEGETPRTGEYEVPVGTLAGTTVTVWLDSNGAPAKPPRSPADAAALGTVAGLTLPMLVWPSLWAFYRLVRRSLDRARLEAWAIEWRRISPRWTR